MNQILFEKLFSKERVNKYFDFFENDANKAILLYIQNIQLSQSLYPLLSITEVSVRNAINRTMQKHYNSVCWFEHLKDFEELNNDVETAIQNIIRRNEDIKPGKITAELTFGFWTKLFNSKYETDLWKPLRLAFPNLPKQERKRKTLTGVLNEIRNLRNRLYHYEPIIWNIQSIESTIQSCYNTLNWIDLELPVFTRKMDNTSIILKDIIELLKEKNN